MVVLRHFSALGSIALKAKHTVASIVKVALEVYLWSVRTNRWCHVAGIYINEAASPLLPGVWKTHGRWGNHGHNAATVQLIWLWYNI